MPNNNLDPTNPSAPPSPATPVTPAQSATHDENFPVASVLCPPRLRPVIGAIYWFARTADDLADEGDATPHARLEALAAYKKDLLAIAKNEAHSGRWPGVFEPLAPVLHSFALPVPVLAQLLAAFEQDVRYTSEGRRYQTDPELLDYCTRSANPVGRLLLHLYGVGDEVSLAQSDEICSALQLINFWQDVKVDAARARWYVTAQALEQFGVTEADFLKDQACPAASLLIAAYARQAKSLMLSGASLACRVPGRAGWELRLVVQGGLRILDKIEALNFETWRVRPKLGVMDFPVLLWRAWRMG